MTTQQYLKFISGLGICLILLSLLTNSVLAATSRFPSEVQSELQATLTTLIQLWPDSLIGTWEGIVTDSFMGNQSQNQIILEIKRTTDGQMIVIQDKFPDIEQDEYKNPGTTDGNLYYCFNDYQVISGERHLTGVRCFIPINDNQLKYFGGDYSVYQYGTLTREPSIPVSNNNLDMTSAQSIAAWINYGLKNGNASVFNDIIEEMPSWGYSNDVEIRPPCEELIGRWCNMSKSDFLQEIVNRIQSLPTCTFDQFGDNFVTIEMHDWLPLWDWPLGQSSNMVFEFSREIIGAQFKLVLAYFINQQPLDVNSIPCPVYSYPVEQSVQPNTPVPDSFSTGDVIQIGSNVFIIIDGQRRLIPNPETLYALGIQNSSINNKGFSEADLSTIPQGDDIPDVNKDPSRLAAFINQYFPSTSPSPSPAFPSPKPWYCSILPLFCPSTVLASTNTDCHPQCVEEARLKRPDLNIWASVVHVADTILARAQTQPIFPQNNVQMQVRVRDQNEQPQTGDIIIWPSSSCQGVYAPVDENGNKLPGGHIGYVASYQDGHLIVHDANWDNKCGIRNEEITLNSCMRFITSPYQIGSIQSVPTPTSLVDSCSQYSGFRWFECKYLGIK